VVPDARRKILRLVAEKADVELRTRRPSWASTSAVTHDPVSAKRRSGMTYCSTSLDHLSTRQPPPQRPTHDLARAYVHAIMPQTTPRGHGLWRDVLSYAYDGGAAARQEETEEIL